MTGIMKLDVFLSYPKDLHVTYKSGFDKFNKYIKRKNINPRTLGVGPDQPIYVPLKEVIPIMTECYGAIVLGYPQLAIKKCELLHPSEKIENIYLPSPWNHIEAALAFERNLPVLIVRHKDTNKELIERGVFGKGATDSFINTADLSDTNWCNSIIDTFYEWKGRVMVNAFRRIFTEGIWRHTYPQSGGKETEDASIDEHSLIYSVGETNKFKIDNIKGDGRTDRIHIDRIDIKGIEPIRHDVFKIIRKKLIKGNKDGKPDHKLTYERK